MHGGLSRFGQARGGHRDGRRVDGGQLEPRDGRGVEHEQRRGDDRADAEHEYAVDVGKAVIDPSPHYSVHQEVVLRRVRTGG
ncbi:hypothetical protein OV203_07500 [Nannocystis sp. ILAH1]|uniref:hypothetical protein n=1 Tax=unclassified Nannocystis TaxID=2627009 RepID=UPI00226ED88C|nr:MULTISPECIES: hypothetical protein [unclassified Nannocystis]MCY0986961.1 hypothetical protein [Nannocystis sp. ILAH1]MCY1071845.1 hypothetical protein [Nannocystis sp. RBIL2]